MHRETSLTWMMKYSPPYIYPGLYEEEVKRIEAESKGFKIVDSRSEPLWREVFAPIFKRIERRRVLARQYQPANEYLRLHFAIRPTDTAIAVQLDAYRWPTES
jgi:hypothetical protein